MDDQLIVRPLDVLQTDNIELIPHGLRLERNTSYEEWEMAGVALKFLETTIQFALGDWLNFGECNYGEKYAQFADPDGDIKFYGRLRNYASVAGRVPLSRRNDKLSYSHHNEVAKLDAQKQEYFLEQAENNNWSIRDLRDEINNGGNEQPVRYCPHCGQKWSG